MAKRKSKKSETAGEQTEKIVEEKPQRSGRTVTIPPDDPYFHGAMRWATALNGKSETDKDGSLILDAGDPNTIAILENYLLRAGTDQGRYENIKNICDQIKKQQGTNKEN